MSPVLDGLYLERHPAVPGEWTTDVDGVCAAAWLPDQAVGYDIARSGQPIGGVTYAGTVSSLTQALSAYLTPRPVGQRIQVVFDNSWLSGVGATETYEAGKPFGAISDAVAPDRYRHYAFLGWCKSQWAEMTTENMLSESTIVPYANLTVYARWQYGYAIRFLPGGGSGVMLRQGCRFGDVCNLDACAFSSPSGKRFAGWACSNGRRYDDGMLVFNLAEPGGTVTMTAIWE